MLVESLGDMGRRGRTVGSHAEEDDGEEELEGAEDEGDEFGHGVE